MTKKEYLEMLHRHKIEQERETLSRCPRCGEWMTDPSRQALSRRADVYICSSCGVSEALEDFCAHRCGGNDVVLKLDDWWLVKNDSGN